MTPHSLPSQVTPSCKYQPDIQPYLLHRATPIHLLFFLLFLFFFLLIYSFFPLFFFFYLVQASPWLPSPLNVRRGLLNFDRHKNTHASLHGFLLSLTAHRVQIHLSYFYCEGCVCAGVHCKEILPNPVK